MQWRDPTILLEEMLLTKFKDSINNRRRTLKFKMVATKKEMNYMDAEGKNQTILFRTQLLKTSMPIRTIHLSTSVPSKNSTWTNLIKYVDRTLINKWVVSQIWCQALTMKTHHLKWSDLILLSIETWEGLRENTSKASILWVTLVGSLIWALVLVMICWVAWIAIQTVTNTERARRTRMMLAIYSTKTSSKKVTNSSQIKGRTSTIDDRDKELWEPMSDLENIREIMINFCWDNNITLDKIYNFIFLHSIIITYLL